MPYIDGFVIPVPTANRDIYRAHELKWWPMFQKHGAKSLVVGWGDDIPPGKQTDFLRAVDAREDETVVLAWMIWPDKETRDTAFAEIMAAGDEVEMPFDGKRMIFGGFTPLLMEGDRT